jgi:hypothetical protein
MDPVTVSTDGYLHGSCNHQHGELSAWMTTGMDEKITNIFISTHILTRRKSPIIFLIYFLLFHPNNAQERKHKNHRIKLA